jgi:CheY-like chemotaxis protein
MVSFVCSDSNRLQPLILIITVDVTLAKDGNEALAAIKSIMEECKTFDVILMDVQMPGLDGIQCTRIAREMGYSAPIVALTAFADEVNKEACIQAGMDYFLPKPVDKQDLKQILTLCMGYGLGTPFPSRTPRGPLSPSAAVIEDPLSHLTTLAPHGLPTPTGIKDDPMEGSILTAKAPVQDPPTPESMPETSPYSNPPTP